MGEGTGHSQIPGTRCTGVEVTSSPAPFDPQHHLTPHPQETRTRVRGLGREADKTRCRTPRPRHAGRLHSLTLRRRVCPEHSRFQTTASADKAPHKARASGLRVFGARRSQTTNGAVSAGEFSKLWLANSPQVCLGGYKTPNQSCNRLHKSGYLLAVSAVNLWD